MKNGLRWLLGISLAGNLLLGIWVFTLLTGPSAGTDATPAVIEPTAPAVAEVFTATPSPEPTATSLPSTPTEPPPTATEAAEISPTPASTPTQTAEPVPTATNTPQPTSTAAPPTATPAPKLTGIAWLDYLNRFRREANLSSISESAALSEGSSAHSRYIVLSGNVQHKENQNSPYFSPAGNTAGVNGNLYADYQAADYYYAMNFWIVSPFHAVPLLDPALSRVGYGSFFDQNGAVPFGATLDVQSGLGSIPEGVEFPLTFPRDQGQIWVVKHFLREFPDPLTSCSGFSRPAGAPLYLFVGDGSLTPAVQEGRLTVEGETLEVCLLTEQSYRNPADYFQNSGRLILDERDAIVMIPKTPLEVGKSYAASITYTTIDADGNASQPQTVEWEFSAVSSPGNQ